MTAISPKVLIEPKKLKGWAAFKHAFTGLRREETISGYLFILPNFIGFAAFTVFPILFAFYMAFMNWDLSKPPEFIGFGNFITLVQDDLFWKSLGNSIYYTLGAVPIGILTAFFLAIMLNQKIRGVIFFERSIFCPRSHWL